MNKGKVLGIGLSKTGTTSLNLAFKILRYKSVDYPQDLNILDKYDAATDITVALSYKYLDEKYPSSKFILTVRNRNTWLVSMVKHYTRYPPKLRSKFVLDIRKKVWGSTDPTKKQMVTAYDKHLKDVASYFKDRDNDLLILNIIAGEGWEKLCRFLGKEIPKETFPWVNKTRPVK